MSSSSPLRCTRLLAGLALSLVSAGALRADETVAISSTASPAYVRTKGPDGQLAPQTYLITKGRFFGGQTAEKTLSSLKFEDVLKTLAPSLAKQNYFPTKDTATADLVIMVHWGVTEIYEDPRGAQNSIEALNQRLAEVNAAVADTGIADPGALNISQAEAGDTAQSQAATTRRNAALLGYDRALSREQQKTVASVEEQTMMMELNEERYLIVLMAYDYKFMQKEKKPRLVWVTRLSVRSPGTNFLEAIPVLARAGSDVFGRELPGLTRVSVAPGKVKIHELEVLGSSEKTPEKKP
jgi:hypothetical protein